MTSTSIYTTFAANPNNDRLILARSRDTEVRGMEWGQRDSSLDEAASDMGAIVLGRVHGGLLCDVSDRLYLLTMQADGPTAVEVATQEDLAL